MSKMNSETGHAPRPETEAERDRRVVGPLKADELRRLVQEGIDSGPGIDVDTVFARLRERVVHSARDLAQLF